MLAQYRVPRHQVEIPNWSCSRVSPSSSKCCSASLRMPSLSGTLGDGLTGKANGKCFCNGQIASNAGSWLRGLAWGEDLHLRSVWMTAFAGSFSARRRSRSSASCSKPIVQYTASRWLRGARIFDAARFSSCDWNIVTGFVDTRWQLMADCCLPQHDHRSAINKPVVEMVSRANRYSTCAQRQ